MDLHPPDRTPRGRSGPTRGILLYLATSDILPEEHASHPTRLTLACTIIGMGFLNWSSLPVRHDHHRPSHAGAAADAG